ncbi:MAG: peptidoglycan DD-metalloendopeptidase family protein [Bacteroidales bacterium]|nr:peptidoglycan DD-metalloendopeptidase family protein [Bacteroidales bacterium]
MKFLSKILIYVILITLFSCQNKPNTEKTEIIDTVKPITLLYGFNIDSFNIKRAKITEGLYIGKLFSDEGIGSKASFDILQKSKPVFDIRKIRRGQPYAVFRSKSDTTNVDYIVYQKSLIEYVVFDFTDTMNVYIGHNQIDTVNRTISATINSNLWFALRDANVNPLLANDLSEIYAWTIDFFGIQKGDYLTVNFDEYYVDTNFVKFGDVHVSLFNHYGKDIYAIPFFQDSITSYYDIDGTSLRRSFLKAPLEYSRIASGFNPKRMHPILKIVRPHYGVDYSAPMGTPVRAIGDGVVLLAQWGGQSGNWIKIRHNGVYETGYLHLSKFGEGIHQGAIVKQGQVIGYVGSTGLSTGPHLDFRVWKNGQPINPLNLDAPPVDPVKPENQARFDSVKNVLLPRIQNDSLIRK